MIFLFAAILPAVRRKSTYLAPDFLQLSDAKRHLMARLFAADQYREKMTPITLAAVNR